MFSYFLGATIILPIGSALFFWRNKNSLLHRAAVFFMTTVLLLSTGWALLQGTGVYQPANALEGVLGAFFAIGNASVIIGTIYWSWRLKDWLLGCLSLTQGGLFAWFLWQTGGVGGPGSFVLDHLSGLILLLVDGVGTIIILFAIQYMETHERRHSLKKSRQPLFLALSFLLLGAMNGVVLTNHLLWMLFFWQATVVCAFLLISHDRSQAALKFAGHFARVCSLGCIAFLAGVSLAFQATGTLVLSELLLFKEATLLLASLACFVVAGMVFSAQLPFQSALIRSTASAKPVSAMLQSSAIVTAGGYLILRLSPVFMNTWLAQIVAVIGAFTFAAAALLAALQHDVKRMLTLTTISCLGLVIALACFPSLQAIYAASLLLVLHGLSKALLFLCSGSHSHSPLPLVLTLLGGASLLMPPFGVPLAQWTAIEAAVRNPVALGLILAGSVFSMIVWTRFVGMRLPSIFTDRTWTRLPLGLYRPQLVLAFAVITLSIFLIPFANYSVTPILKENYGRFGDIAQGNATAFQIRDFSGIDPLWTFAALSLIFGLGWFGVRVVAARTDKTEPSASEIVIIDAVQAKEMIAQDNNVPASDTAMDKDEDAKAETALQVAEMGMPEELTESRSEAELIIEKIEPDEIAAVQLELIVLTEAELKEADSGLTEVSDATNAAPPAADAVLDVPRCNVFSAFPDARKTDFYATVVAGSLIILMLEVVFR